MTKGTERHPHDISDANLEKALSIADRRDLLRDIVDRARQAFGFFTSHYSHTLSYPWVLERLEDLPSGAEILDVGAGVSALPLILAGHGMLVDCVDGSGTIRKLPVGPDWNEWGFFDYSVLNSNIHSYHCKIQDFTPANLYDAIYSVGVISHMPRSERVNALRLMRSWLKPGGKLVLSIALIPTTDFLWNRYEGREVEPPEIHGLRSDVLTELEILGFRITENRVSRDIHASPTDLLFLECSLFLPQVRPPAV